MKVKNKINQDEQLNSRQSRLRLLSDSSFQESWMFLLSSPKWVCKSPRSRLYHLDRLARYPTDFATYLVDRALVFDLPFVVQDNCIKQMFDAWKDLETIRNFIPPTVEEVSAFCREKGYNINPEKFVRYYEKRGWMNSSGKVLTTWKANVITWNSNAKHYDKF